jgi:retron-type reverse transcriptase
VIEPIFEADFCPHSYGFRPNRSAHDAVDDIATTLRAGYTQVIDADLSKYFDNLDRELLMRAVRTQTQEPWVLLYIERWLKAPIEMPDGTQVVPEKGTQQGGVASPLLAESLSALCVRSMHGARVSADSF